MCGRYALADSAEDIALQFAADGTTTPFLPAQWNISPTSPIYFVNSVPRKIEVAAWGLIPSWSKDNLRASNTINARVESITEKPSFRSAFRSRRCLIPASGYYEWATELGRYKPKQPFFIYNEDNSLLPMAGIYEEWRNPETGEMVTSAAIITRESTGIIAPIHHRMPIMLPRDRWDQWLAPVTIAEKQVPDYLDLLELDSPDAGLAFRPVSSAVNNARNSGPALAEGIELGEPETLF